MEMHLYYNHGNYRNYRYAKSCAVDLVLFQICYLCEIVLKKLMAIEDLMEEERKDMNAKLEHIQSIVRTYELKAKNTHDHSKWWSPWTCWVSRMFEIPRVPNKHFYNWNKPNEFEINKNHKLHNMYNGLFWSVHFVRTFWLKVSFQYHIRSFN